MFKVLKKLKNNKVHINIWYFTRNLPKTVFTAFKRTPKITSCLNTELFETGVLLQALKV